jgi:hypothetical protein
MDICKNLDPGYIRVIASCENKKKENGTMRDN